jgi:TolA-binding protein
LDDLEEMITVFNSACQPIEYARPADNIDISGNSVEEWEQVNGEYYRHGEFNFHTYSAAVGESPAFVNNYNGQPYSEADQNNDNYISVIESYIWEETHESIDVGGSYAGEEPLYSDLGNIGGNTSLEYPTLLHTDVTTNINYRGLIGISKDIHVTTGNQLTFNNNADIYLLNNAKLIVDAGATLVIQDNVQFLGNHNNSIQVNGNIQIGQNLTFARNGNSGYFDGLYLNNKNMQATITGATFNKTRFYNYGASLVMNNCTFNDCYIARSHRGYVTISNSNFDRTWLYLENQTNDPNLIATVSGCNFSTNYTMAGIDLWYYGKYFIENNTIQGYYNGMQINYSGKGNTGNQSIFGNHIYNSAMAAILAYNTIGSIAGNNIHNNKYGVRLMNGCNVALFGNASAQNQSQTQQIKDNTSYEVYASQFSFPWYFRFNEIIDEDNLGNPTDPMVLHDRPNVPPLLKLDVRYNCWGNHFNPDQDLKTTNGVYKWYPTWCPGGGGIEPDPIEDMYLSAVEQFENDNYTAAKNLFQLLIQQYPKSDYAQAAMKELLRLEEYVASDYTGLKEYYLTNDSITTDTVLVKLGDILANKCDVNLENWPQAISWYENKIINPTCLEDSVFAIIDLGYVYFLMENQGLKSTYTGDLKQFKPESKEKYFEHKDFLLSLLPGEMMSYKLRTNLTNLAYGSLLHNVPNPFSENTQVWYKIDEMVSVAISVTDITGKEIKMIDQGTKDKGTYMVDFVNTNLTPGTYFYSLLINGQKSDTKKMVIMR